MRLRTKHAPPGFVCDNNGTLEMRRRYTRSAGGWICHNPPAWGEDDPNEDLGPFEEWIVEFVKQNGRYPTHDDRGDAYVPGLGERVRIVAFQGSPVDEWLGTVVRLPEYQPRFRGGFLYLVNVDPGGTGVLFLNESNVLLENGDMLPYIDKETP